MIEKILFKAALSKALIATGLLIVMYILINLSPLGVAGLTKITGGASILDLEMFGYSAEKAYSMLGQLGAEGRNFYNYKILPIDFFFPLTYMSFFVCWIAFFLKQIKGRKILYIIFLIPILAMFFDFSENICILTMLAKYPSFIKSVYMLSGIFTILKTVFTVLSIVSVLILFVIFIVKIRKPKVNKTKKQ